VAELLAEGKRLLKSAGIDNPETSARSILQRLLNKSPSELQLACDSLVPDDLAISFDELITKRSEHHPLQYLLGEIEFYNVRLKVDPRTLIPRPETEMLVDQALEILKVKKPARVLDIGTGSGNIAIAIAANVKDTEVTAVDVTEETIELARDNARFNNIADKIKFLVDDCFKESFWESLGQFDLIVSNPPYIADYEFEALQLEVKLYEPKRALLAGRDPLIFFKTICDNAKNILKPDGAICFEVGIGQAPDVAEILGAVYKDIKVEIIKDLPGIDRVVIGQLLRQG